jgi:hypothetical protein
MANALKGEAELVAGDKTYTLVFDINSLCEAEDAAGMETRDILTALEHGNPIKVLRALVYAGLQRKHPCHLIGAGEVVQAAGIGAAREAVEKGLAAAFPVAEKVKPARPLKAAGGAS